MKILITGNSGYIGSHLTKILKQQNQHELYGLDKSYPSVEVDNFVLLNNINRIFYQI